MISRIVGPPGCGKTTYLSRQVRLAYEAGHEVMICSLTNAAAVEIVKKQEIQLPREVTGTLHSHAYRSLRAGKIDIADDAAHLAEWNDAHPTMQLSGGRVVDEDNAAPYSGQPTETDTSYLDYNNQRARLVSREHWRQSTQAFASAWEHWKREQALMDFTDLLESALRDVNMAPGNPGVMFADEAQDFSALEMALLRKWGDEAGRLVVVGDPWQSLYEWRGADASVVFGNAMDIDRVLNQSYRVPVSIHSKAMDWISQMPGYFPIDYFPTDQPGAVLPCSATSDRPDKAMDVIEQALTDGQNVMYLASCGRMLKPALALLRQRGIPFHNDYRRTEGAWNPLQARKNAVTGAQRLASFLRLGEEGTWNREDVRRWGAAVKGSGVFPDGVSWKRLEPMIADLPDGPIDQGLWEMLVGEAAIEASMSQDLNWWLDNLLASRRSSGEYPAQIARARGRQALLKTPTVCVGTVHSVKGGEADVVILSPDVSVPGAQEWAASDSGKAAIYRLFYVGMTRAKQTLHIMQPANPSRSVKLL